MTRTPGTATQKLRGASGPDELWTVEDLSGFLKKPTSWVYENYRELFPYYRMGQAVRFDPEEIRAVLRQRYRFEK
ncbi:hypothetical protein SAMN04489712_13818 [Thermomonospora echinospora]|uniref:Helix-turn-helix domain-containing protein n=1 Tax=Thermomonospora echinospora TaxID=1992 RepID=A0A1H6E694_9ACTN|nr:DNA-binding protein [Thermomonospora echinospora]SEG93318.1 hypothetical protein SAMN04489712_13818 [Thermomonospora echinospora]